MAVGDFPGNSPISDDKGMVSFPWLQWFQRVQNVVLAAYSSGTTAERPTKLLWIGQRFFDTTLGKPVFVKSVGPVVWVDGAGTVS